MNPYIKLADVLSWKQETADVICSKYQDYLITKICDYASRPGVNSSSLCELVEVLDNADLLSKFVVYPFVADLLHPRTKINDDDNLTPLLAYTLSFLAASGVVSPSNAIFEIPPSYNKKRKNSLAVYMDSRLTYPNMTGGNRVQEIPNSSKKSIRAKVSRSLELYEEIGGHVLHFVQSGTQLLCIQDETEESHRFGSASFRGFAGLNLLLNPRHASTWTIADAILHEAIHSVLYQIEPFHCRFFKDIPESKKAISSPWTGNQITVDNLFQASYVWYGLYNFWKRVSDTSDFSECRDFGFERCSFISKGFMVLDAGQLKECLSADALEGLRHLLSTLTVE